MDSLCQKIALTLPAPTLEDSVGDKERLLRELSPLLDAPVELPYRVLRTLYPLCRLEEDEEGDPVVTATVIRHPDRWEVVRVEKGDTSHRSYGYAVDLGSTTVIMELVDLATGQVLAQESDFNGQIPWGEEILSRIFYVKHKPQRLRELQEATLNTLRGLIARLEGVTGVAPADCGLMVLAGNTTMTHLLLGIDPWPIFPTPGAPVFNDAGFIPAGELGLPLGGEVFCLPSVADYLGGDLVAGILASGIASEEEPSILMDIGTNGELIVGCRDFLTAVAGAAGPALEGGISKHGMRAGPGAIDTVTIEGPELRFTTIAGEKPRGICGSGVVDLLAQLMLNGWVDLSGTMREGVSPRMVRKGEELAVVYATAEESAQGEDLCFTQEDLRSFMATKAAANTMVAYLLDSLGLDLSQIAHFFPAGAFGVHLNLESAITIGLYPDLPREKFEILGNTSLKGARMLLLDRALLPVALDCPQQVVYQSLADAKDFLHQMQAAMFLPHTHMDAYPTVKAELQRRGLLPKI